MCANYNRKDRLYERAKSEGFRSRAAYKLLEINKKYNILPKGARVLDLGAWPGGWLQVAADAVGPQGTVVGIDLVQIDELPSPNVHLITGDAREEANIERCLAIAGGRFDVVVSDMSPKLTGIREADQAGAVACAELALFIAGQVLKDGGALIIKGFKGNDIEQFIRQSRPQFTRLARVELEATRKTSNEFYILGFGFKGSAQQ